MSDVEQHGGHGNLNTKIVAQRDCNYRHITDTIALLPAALRESDPNARPDQMKALHSITTATTGANRNLYFAVAERSGVTVGFLGASFVNFAFEDRAFAQEVISFVSPEYRDTNAYEALSKAFCAWAFEMGAVEVRRNVMNHDDNGKTAEAAGRLGYQPVGRIVALKRGA